MKSKNHYDICIIGAGASGLAAALEAADTAPEARILLLEKNDAPGRKIRATGNGRCNISNLQAENSEKALAFLRKWGIATRTYPTGLIYPYSESAADVAELLARQVEASGVELWTNATVTALEYRADSFTIQVEESGKQYAISAHSVILATGGKAGPQYGTIGDGYRLLRKLGHTVRSTIPVLTPVDCAEADCKDLAGTRAKGRILLRRKSPDGWTDIFGEEGEIQFTASGLSGICVFNMTRHMRYDRDEGLDVFRMAVDLCPDLDARAFLQEQRDAARKGRRSVAASNVMASLLKKKLVKIIFRRAEISEDISLADLSDSDIESLAAQIHELTFRPTGVHGWKEAQCTSGGVLLEELNPETGESGICPGLYVTGELQDYDGPCGGYNLNHAWNTGAAAGRAAGLAEL